ncbi:MAG: hypothetical protein U0Y10_20840 [Spirosomataceae bacterium]
MTTTAFLPKSPQLKHTEDYRWLREQGISFVQKFAGKIWTDYNTHDPGVTILELLCYALTDLGYRTNFPMADLLTDPGHTTPRLNKRFYEAPVILRSNPITLQDWRKVLLSIEGIRNAWLDTKDDETYIPNLYYEPKTDELSYNLPDTVTFQKALKISGLYRIKIELEAAEQLEANPQLKTNIEAVTGAINWLNPSPAEEQAIKTFFETKVRAVFHSHRNVCEDMDDVNFMTAEPMGICADFELEKDIPNDQYPAILCQIRQKIDNYLSPPLPRYSLTQLLEKGRSVEEIFEGPYLPDGFIDNGDLEQFEQRTVVYVSDLINLLSDIPGILAIRKLWLADQNGQSFQACLHLTDPNHSIFKFDPTRCSIQFFKGVLPLLRKATVAQLMESCSKSVVSSTQPLQTTFPPIASRNRSVGTYFSIQNEFPHNYQLGEEGISERATPLRKAQRLQLKAYLLFFEQLLTDYLAQLNQAKQLFSWKSMPANSTYPSQMLSDITDLAKVLDTTAYQDFATHQWYSPATAQELDLERRNRFLDHLIARFCEQFTDYSLLKFTHDLPDSGINLAQPDEELIKDKIRFLREYPQISGDRSKAFDYQAHNLWNTSHVTGFERRLGRILGIDKVMRRDLSGIAVNSPFNEAMGYFLIEHLLLRPHQQEQALLHVCCTDENGQLNNDDLDFCKDPYSMRASLVFPGWLRLTQNLDFRHFVEQVAREEAPAHVLIKICWVDQPTMLALELAWKQFLEVITQTNTPAYTAALEQLVKVMNALKNTYPDTFLHDCEESVEHKDAPFVLGQGKLGKKT